MLTSVGVGLAFVAMLCWGFGDFLIQRSTRRIGDWETLFVICAFGSVILLPFVIGNLSILWTGGFKVLGVLLACSVILFIAALLDFEALREGKLAVVEPIWSFEVPASGILAYFIIGEKVSFYQIVIMVMLIIGMAMVSIKETHSVKKYLMERGVILAFVAAFVMGSANFFLGWGSRLSDPLMANFILNIFITVVTGLYLLSKGKLSKTFKDAVKYRSLLLPMSISDNAAWIAFAFAMSLAPIAVAVALSESYIIVAVILGLLVNRERLQRHQKVGLVVAVLSAIILAAATT
jgi:uncharacterized membrane protein